MLLCISTYIKLSFSICGGYIGSIALLYDIGSRNFNAIYIGNICIIKVYIKYHFGYRLWAIDFKRNPYKYAESSIRDYSFIIAISVTYARSGSCPLTIIVVIGCPYGIAYLRSHILYRAALSDNGTRQAKLSTIFITSPYLQVVVWL